MKRAEKIWILAAVGLALLLGLLLWGIQTGSRSFPETTAATRASSEVDLDRDMPEGMRQTAKEMRKVLVACRDYATTHRGNWPGSLDDVRASVQGTDVDHFMYCYFGYKLETPREGVLVESHPIKGGGQLIGFADGRVEWEPTFDWDRHSRNKDSSVILFPVLDLDWPGYHGGRFGVVFTFDDLLDVPDAPRVVVSPAVLLSDNCFQSAEVVPNKDGTVSIRIIPAGNMHDLLLGQTRDNLNHRLAVVLVEKGEPHLVGAPVIREESGESLLLPGPYKAEVAADLVRRVNVVLKEQWAEYGPPKR
jgi:hypothetical protein